MFKDIFHNPQAEAELKILEQKWQVIREQLFHEKADCNKLFDACDWILSHLRLVKWSAEFDWVLLIQALHFLQCKQGVALKNLAPLLFSLYSTALSYGATCVHFIEAFQALGERKIVVISPEFPEREHRNGQSLVEIAAIFWARANQPIEDILRGIELLCSAIEPTRRIVLLNEIAKTITLCWINQNNASEVLGALKKLQQWGVRLDQITEGRMNLISMVIFSWRRIKVPIKDLQDALRYFISQDVDMKSPGLFLSSPLHNIGEFFVDVYRFHDVKETIECFFPSASDPHRLLHVTDRMGRTPLLVMVDRWLKSTVSFGQVFGVIKVFIERGADVNAVCGSGQTVFHIVVQRSPVAFTREVEAKEMLHYLFAKNFKLIDPIEQLYFIGVHQYIACRARVAALTTLSKLFKALSKVQTPVGFSQYRWIFDSAILILGIPFLDSVIGANASQSDWVLPACILLRHYCQNAETLSKAGTLYQQLSLGKVDHPFYSETLENAQTQIVSLASKSEPREFMLSARLLADTMNWNEATLRYVQVLDSDIRRTFQFPEDRECLTRIDEVVTGLIQLPVKANPPIMLKVLILFIRAEHLDVDCLYRLLEAYNLSGFFSKRPFEQKSGASQTPDSLFGHPPHFGLSAAQSYLHISNFTEEGFAAFLERARLGQLKPGEDEVIQIMKAFSQAMAQENSALPKTFFSKDVQLMKRLNVLMSQQCAEEHGTDKTHQGGRAFSY